MRRRERGVLSLLCGVALVLALGCSNQTQLIVVVDTNLDIPGEIDGVQLVVTAPDGIQTVTPQALSGPSAASFPLTMGITPEGDARGPINVAAIGTLAGVEVVRQSARGLTLVDGETHVLHLLLLRSCVSRTCTDGRTCTASGCASPDLDVADLDVWTGEPPPFDDSDPCLAMPWDVDGDGHGDDACGGDDCDDTEPAVHAGLPEACDGIDNNCDGMTDEDCDCSPLAAMEPCTTSCGSTGERTCETTGWGACRTLVEVCNAIDDDCDGATDEGFAYVVSAPVNVTDHPAISHAPDMIRAGDGFALVWSDDIDGAGVHIALLDATGAVTFGPTNVGGDGEVPAIAASDSEVAVAWSERVGYSDCCDTTCVSACTFYDDPVFVRVFAADGTAVSARTTVEGDASSDPRVRVVWDGSAFGVSFHDGDLYVRRYGRDGAALGASVLVAPTNDERADARWTGRDYAFGWARSDRVWFTEGNDTAGFPAAPLMVAAARQAHGTALGWTGDGFLMVWAVNEATTRVETLALDRLGAPAGAPGVLTVSARDTRGFISYGAPIGLAEAPGQVVVAWPDLRDGDAGGIYAARVSTTGAILQDATRVSTLPGDGAWVTAAALDDRFGIAWEEDPAVGREEIFFAGFACP